MINIEIKLIINITDMKDKNHKHRQGGFNCSCLPAGLGGNGEFERKFERKIFKMKSAWEEAPLSKSPCPDA